ncbi:MAG TPA: hypothetical protein VH063_16205 [Gaiellaceae bacterium]|jgi:hypothetical protein|nr:hypothetical protein [Gaiellaceae bacterium]
MVRYGRLVALIALAAGALSLAPGGEARLAATPSLQVTFAANGTIAVTLADGTPVGSVSGTPTTIPAGYYTILLAGPGGCTYLPTFELKGPGESISSNLQDGEVMSTGFNADFLPNSTYVWRNDGTSPPTTYTFTTSSDVVGAPPSTATGTGKLGPVTIVSSQDVLGSAVLKFKGTLSAAVAASGKPSLAFHGKSITKLAAGKYTLTVVDKSSAARFMLQKGSHAAMAMSGLSTRGTHKTTIYLTAGRWSFTAGRAAKTYFVVS